ncbi:hypothetical protein Tco_1523542 [Tanacetum coccineum]
MIGELKFFLGILIHQSPRGIFINQAKLSQHRTSTSGEYTSRRLDKLVTLGVRNPKRHGLNFISIHSKEQSSVSVSAIVHQSMDMISDSRLALCLDKYTD